MLAAGSLSTLGLASLSGAGRAGGHAVRVWFSERAAAYSALESRVTGYLRRALADAPAEFEVSVGDAPIPLEEEGGARLLTTDWPRRVLAGAVGSGPIRPVASVNLLVTDGDPSESPPGYGMRGIAATTGAQYLAEMPPAEKAPSVMDNSLGASVTQLLLHECGHALGLEHAHGTVRVDEDVIVASPMVGAYAWADEDVRRRQIGRDRNSCGDAFPTASPDRRQLELRFGRCALGAIDPLGPGRLG